MRYLLDKVIHFLTSNSRHGTHSPFVYAIADQAIYAPSDSSSIEGIAVLPTKYRAVVARILTHLRISQVSLCTDDRWGDENLGAVFLGDITQQDSRQVLEFVRRSPIVLVDGIYKNSTAKSRWKALISDSDVTVGIDLFYFGILIRRQGQYKENFKLRFPFWL